MMSFLFLMPISARHRIALKPPVLSMINYSFFFFLPSSILDNQKRSSSIANNMLETQLSYCFIYWYLCEKKHKKHK